MKRVLFLDIDGVLNSNIWNDSHQKEISDGTLIDEEKIKILAPLIKRTVQKWYSILVGECGLDRI